MTEDELNRILDYWLEPDAGKASGYPCVTGEARASFADVANAIIAIQCQRDLMRTNCFVYNEGSDDGHSCVFCGGGMVPGVFERHSKGCAAYPEGRNWSAH